MSKNIQTVPTKDFEDVVATVAKYVKGLRIGSVTDLAQAFYKVAVMYGFTNGKLLGGPIKNLYDFVEKNGTAPDIKTRIDVLSITPTTGGGACGHGEGCDRRRLHRFPHAYKARWHLAHYCQGLSHV
jgi:Putative lumazine-binding